MRIDRHHVAWTILGVLAVPGLWFAWSLPGAIVMFGCIAAAFVLWNRLGSRGSWLALIIVGAGMAGVLGWQAATGSRCPAPGTTVFLKEGKPPVGCTEIRASAASMAAFFGLVALIGIAAPIYARTAGDDDPAALDA